MTITSPKQAKQAGASRYFTGKPCVRGHVSERMASNRRCVECLASSASQWRNANRAIVSAASKAWVEANREKVRELKKAWNAANPEVQKVRSRKWYLANKAKANAQHYTWVSRNQERAKTAIREWVLANPGRAAATAAKRRSAKMLRTPGWADLSAIREIYQDAAEFRAAGLAVDVDHVIPLQGALVSGLHVPANLTVCLSSFNRAKSNTFQI